jgi:RHS repeat-associated protein
MRTHQKVDEVRKRKDCVISANTRRYYYNYNWQILSEFDGSGGYKKSYIYGNYIDEVLMSVGTIFVSTHKYYLHDHLYSPVALTDNDGVVVERYEYDAYGKCYILEPNFAPDPDGKSDVGNPFMFTGRELDIPDNGSLKIMNYRHRYYDTYTGRFSSHDPTDYLDGMNLYEYAASHTINRIDPLGFKNCCIGSTGSTEHGIPIPGIGWPIRPLPIPIGRVIHWALCEAVERAIAAIVRDHLDDAWRNYAGMSGPTRNPVPLSESDMEEIIEKYGIREKVIEPLIEECQMSSEGWLNRTKTVGMRGSSFGYRECYYYLRGDWVSVLGYLPLTVTSTCKCKTFEWKIVIHEEFDFEPIWTGCGLSEIFRSSIVGSVRLAEWALQCGWTDFFYDGEISRKEPIPCSYRKTWKR